MKPYYASPEKDFVLFGGDCREVVPDLPGKFEMIFADPPYFLSNGGISVQSGKAVCVDKGAWDKSHGLGGDAAFNLEWLDICRGKLEDSGTIWVCGTFHNIFSVANALTKLGYRILNAIVWQKTNPPPNLSCRFFTHSTEIIIWARKCKKVPHCFNYDLMRRLAGNRQMTDVWRMPAIAPWEKSCGKHPTQKPIALAVRAILASTSEGARILDPFAGSGTTGIAANLVGRNFVGVDAERAYLRIAAGRRREYEVAHSDWRKRIPDLQKNAE